MTPSSSFQDFTNAFAPWSSRSRVMLSSQMLWPALCSNWVAFIIFDCCAWSRLMSCNAFHSGSDFRRQRIFHNLLRLGHDDLQMLLIAKTLRINLVNVFRAGRPGGEPAAARHDFQPAYGRVVARGTGQLGGDGFPGQLRLANPLRRKLSQARLLFA